MFNNKVYLTINSQQSTINDQQLTINNHVSRMCLLRRYFTPFALCCSKPNRFFFCCPPMSPLRTSLLDIRDDCRVCILPNIRQKNRRDVDGTLGTSALRFDGIAICVAKPSESSIVEFRHKAIESSNYYFST